MIITLAAVGRFRPGPEKTLYEHFAARLTWRLTLKEVEEKRPLPPRERIAREGQGLQGCIPKGAVIVALDERGASLGSSAFAHCLSDWRDHGRQDVAFLIGGADGLAPGIRDQADLLLSFGAMTWPHLLVRGMLAEQLYRAESILAHHPYHRE